MTEFESIIRQGGRLLENMHEEESPDFSKFRKIMKKATKELEKVKRDFANKKNAVDEAAKALSQVPSGAMGRRALAGAEENAVIALVKSVGLEFHGDDLGVAGAIVEGQKAAEEKVKQYDNILENFRALPGRWQELLERASFALKKFGAKSSEYLKIAGRLREFRQQLRSPVGWIPGARSQSRSQSTESEPVRKSPTSPMAAEMFKEMRDRVVAEGNTGWEDDEPEPEKAKPYFDAGNVMFGMDPTPPTTPPTQTQGGGRRKRTRRKRTRRKIKRSRIKRKRSTKRRRT